MRILVNTTNFKSGAVTCTIFWNQNVSNPQISPDAKSTFSAPNLKKVHTDKLLESFFCTKVRKNYQSGMPLLFQVKLSGQFEFSRLFCKFLGKNDFALTRNRTPDPPLMRRACYLKTNRSYLKIERMVDNMNYYGDFWRQNSNLDEYFIWKRSGTPDW